jgi:hypothetical protein
MNLSGLEPLTWILLVLLVAVFPLMGRHDLRSLRGAVDRGDTGARLGFY